MLPNGIFPTLVQYLLVERYYLNIGNYFIYLSNQFYNSYYFNYFRLSVFILPTAQTQISSSLMIVNVTYWWWMMLKVWKKCGP